MTGQVYVKASEQVTLIYPHLGIFSISHFWPIVHHEQDMFIDSFHVQGFVFFTH